MEGYLLFVMACLLLVFVPGPDMVYILSRTLVQGRRAGVVATLGVNLGTYIHLFVAITGLYAVVVTSALLFNVVKIAGVCYLLGLGLLMLFGRSASLQKSRASDFAMQRVGPIFLQGFLCNLLNPKLLIFYFSFLPQFIAVERDDFTQQYALMGVTLSLIALSGNLLLVFLASHAKEVFTVSRRLNEWLPRVLGGVFILLGARLAAYRP